MKTIVLHLYMNTVVPYLSMNTIVQHLYMNTIVQHLGLLIHVLRPTFVLCWQIIDDMLFAIGGFNGVTTIFNVECYDINADEWYVATLLLATQ